MSWRCGTALIVVLAALGAAPAAVMIDTDFGMRGKSVDWSSADGGAKITGELPGEWRDNSNWQKQIEIRYAYATAEGRSFLHVEKVRGGGVQLNHPLPPLTTGGHFRVTATLRSPQHTGIELGFRHAGPPYQMIWSVHPDLNETWQTFSWEFTLPAQKQELGIWLNFSEVGAVELAAFKLESFTAAELIERIRAEHPDGGSGNFVRVSRFPLGLPTGWSLDRDCDDELVKIEADPATRGPSGAPALRIDTDRAWVLRSAPFAVPWSFEPHTVSLAVKGDAPNLRLDVYGDGTGCGGRVVPLTKDWQRVSFTFKPRLQGRVHTVWFSAKGRVWLDALQVERGSAATAYRSQKQCEVTLACPPGQAGRTNIRFPDEPLRVTYAVTGAPAGAVLQVRQVDLYGTATTLPTQRVKEGALVTGTLDLQPSAAHPWNSYRLETWVEDGHGAALSAPDEVVVHRLRKPRYWGQDHPASAFGIHVNPTTRHLQMAKAIGFNWVRLHDAGTQYLGWSFLEPERGQWQFFDADIQRYRGQHLSVLGLYSTAPNWATGYPKKCSGYFDRYYEPQDLAAWATYVKTVTTHYRGVVDHFEVWNEPWGEGFWAVYDATAKDQRKRSATAAQDYAKLQAVAYQAAKQVNPKVTVLGFNSYGEYGGREWTGDVMRAGGLETCDVFSYHKYTSAFNGFPGDDINVNGLAGAAEQIVKAQGALRKPAWMSEGAPLRCGTYDGLYRVTLTYPNEDRVAAVANDQARFILATLRDGADKLFCYTAHGFSTFNGKAPDWRQMVTNEGMLHPSGVANSNICWLLEDTKYAGVTEVAKGVFAYRFTGAGRTVTAFCTAPQHAAYRLPAVAGERYVDVFGNPLAADTALTEQVVFRAAAD